MHFLKKKKKVGKCHKLCFFFFLDQAEEVSAAHRSATALLRVRVAPEDAGPPVIIAPGPPAAGGADDPPHRRGHVPEGAPVGTRVQEEGGAGGDLRFEVEGGHGQGVVSR